MQAVTRPMNRKALTARSAVANGSRLLAGLDGRTAQARRYRDLMQAFADDMGGPDALTEMDRAAIRIAAGNMVAAEEMQSRLLRGVPVSEEEMTRASNAASRSIERLRRRPGAQHAPGQPPSKSDADQTEVKPMSGASRRQFDGRSSGARRLRAIKTELLSGIASPTAAQRDGADRAAVLQLQLEGMHAAMARDEPVDDAALRSLVRTISSQIAASGLREPAKPVRTADEIDPGGARLRRLLGMKGGASV